MYKYIDIDLRNGADDVCSVYSIGRDSENLASALKLYLPDKYLNCSIMFEFEIADGSKYTSKPLVFEPEIVYPLRSFLMVEGLMKIAVVLTDVSLMRVMKPFERTFVVSESVNALFEQGYEYILATNHEERIAKVEKNKAENIVVSSADEGKFMRVRNGKWTAEKVPNAEEEFF